MKGVEIVAKQPLVIIFKNVNNGLGEYSIERIHYGRPLQHSQMSSLKDKGSQKTRPSLSSEAIISPKRKGPLSGEIALLRSKINAFASTAS